jgi:hypothetical protein
MSDFRRLPKSVTPAFAFDLLRATSGEQARGLKNGFQS